MCAPGPWKGEEKTQTWQLEIMWKTAHLPTGKSSLWETRWGWWRLCRGKAWCWFYTGTCPEKSLGSLSVRGFFVKITKRRHGKWECKEKVGAQTEMKGARGWKGRAVAGGRGTGGELEQVLLLCGIARPSAQRGRGSFPAGWPPMESRVSASPACAPAASNMEHIANKRKGKWDKGEIIIILRWFLKAVIWTLLFITHHKGPRLCCP